MGAKKRRRKSAPAKPASADKVEMITLRIRPETKLRLLRHCQRRSLDEGRQLSYNQAIIDLIEAASP